MPCENCVVSPLSHSEEAASIDHSYRGIGPNVSTLHLRGSVIVMVEVTVMEKIKAQPRGSRYRTTTRTSYQRLRTTNSPITPWKTDS